MFLTFTGNMHFITKSLFNYRVMTLHKLGKDIQIKNKTLTFEFSKVQGVDSGNVGFLATLELNGSYMW